MEREVIGGGYAKGIARKEEIIEAATAYFGRVGFHKATMIQIAADCGISRAGLLHHFGSKEELLAAVLETRERVDYARFRAHIEMSPPGLGVLRSFVAGALESMTTPGLVGLYVVLSAEATDSEHPAHDYFAARYERVRSGVTMALEQAKEAGSLRDDVNIDVLAAELPALMDGLQVQWLLAPHKIDMAAVMRGRLQQILTVPL
ncbi:TetR/AcrR family transcriptional regulator [Herbiconiux daphne]|uniref:TetR/AcrR family transcriptional regulator n=1 Tax=Herbiconiux daphne TaxID=2970914 RepID=A0ABT2H745_9MICO|nr:TetR/AcrR family transcriptional regulator [Herbiconiux daphne]MCS5735724.1 TetR/AcrR family transcriptional regulator [Herbiconiux daphne]